MLDRWALRLRAVVHSIHDFLGAGLRHEAPLPADRNRLLLPAGSDGLDPPLFSYYRQASPIYQFPVDWTGALTHGWPYLRIQTDGLAVESRSGNCRNIG